MSWQQNFRKIVFEHTWSTFNTQVYIFPCALSRRFLKPLDFLIFAYSISVKNETTDFYEVFSFFFKDGKYMV